MKDQTKVLSKMSSKSKAEPNFVFKVTISENRRVRKSISLTFLWPLLKTNKTYFEVV